MKKRFCENILGMLSRACHVANTISAPPPPQHLLRNKRERERARAIRHITVLRGHSCAPVDSLAFFKSSSPLGISRTNVVVFMNATLLMWRDSNWDGSTCVKKLLSWFNYEWYNSVQSRTKRKLYVRCLWIEAVDYTACYLERRAVTALSVCSFSPLCRTWRKLPMCQFSV